MFTISRLRQKRKEKKSLQLFIRSIHLFPPFHGSQWLWLSFYYTEFYAIECGRSSSSSSCGNEETEIKQTVQVKGNRTGNSNSAQLYQKTTFTLGRRINRFYALNNLNEIQFYLDRMVALSKMNVNSIRTHKYEI